MAIDKQNISTPYYRPGQEISAYVASAVTGKTFVKISADRQAGPALNTSTGGGNLTIAPATAAGAVFGVATYDGAVGDIIPVHTAPGMVIPVTAGGTITAGAEVEVGTGGKAVAFSAGIKVGLCVSGATNNNDAQIKLY
jgi:hypothetical protein